jgi:cytoskeletal protein CcmA (bactofilin family)
MFSNKSKDTAVPAASATTSSAQQQKRPLRSSAAPSIISGDLVVTGTLTSSGDIQIDGKVEGNVNSAGLVIGDKACIEGDVMAEDVTVRGCVKGSIRARKILLASTCHVEGDILHEAFAVETGAFFEGNCRHADNPLADGALKNDRRAPPVTSTPATIPTPATFNSVGTISPRPTEATARPSTSTFTPVTTTN